MGGTLFIFLLTITHVSLLLNLAIATLNPNIGFSLKMIHRDSKESPLYIGDRLTRDQRLQRFVEQSKARAHYIESQILLESNATYSMNPDALQFTATYNPGMFYVASVGLGTFPGKQQQSFMNYYLVIDSGSAKTWLQCEGATETFVQDVPLYPWKSSTTYHPVPCNTHPLCTVHNCNSDEQCTYASGYMSGSSTSGVFAKEKFTLGSDTNASESIELYMGCGLVQKNFDGLNGNGKPNVVAGILGLGQGPESFLNQLGAAGLGKFSYCFQTFNENTNASDTYLRFGADATIGTRARRLGATPIVVPTQFLTPLYYLKLEDVSVGDKRVRFPRGTFELNNRAEGGSIIDTGSPLSHMYKDHFDRVAGLVRAHFDELGVRYIGPQHGFDVCFEGIFETLNYPPITLHFQGADYVISDHEANFMRLGVDTVCLGFLRQDGNIPAFILGAMQQTNKRIVYDTILQALFFGDEYCKLN
ncbi:aspartic proteinase CDR1-like [Papaver somniferum]|uniref:aspartic proteinase CDR1-like n=1 Tax=Papaver somniferum TaxID=3469 RepID=UPI000E6F8A61|nr:aspartic proteinase CDR1-like [Papaver somniferum]